LGTRGWILGTEVTYVNQRVERRIAELRMQIRYHNHRYYVLDDPVVSDSCRSWRRRTRS